jgi:hypothetical protein
MLNEGFFSPSFEDKASNSNFTLGSLIYDKHNTLQHAKNRKEADIRHLIRTGSLPEREEKEDEREEDNEPKEYPHFRGDYIERRQQFKQFQANNKHLKEGCNMDSYKDHLLILDEFASPYSKNNWNKHHQDTGARSAYVSGSKHYKSDRQKTLDRWRKDIPTPGDPSFNKKSLVADSMYNRSTAGIDNRANRAEKDYNTTEKISRSSGSGTPISSSFRRYKSKK